MITMIRVMALSSLLISAACYAQISPQEPSRATGAAREGDPMTGDADWDALNSNQDGYLTKEELQGSPALVHNFDRIDTDHDGKISREEWKMYGHDNHR
jgi:hypothetical protein